MTANLDYSQKRVLQLTNDAFFFLLNGEEPLDENNLEEAQRISCVFPQGFLIEESWKYIKQSGLVECTIIPYLKQKEEPIDFEAYENLSKYIQLQIKWLSPSTIKAWWYNKQTNTRELLGEFLIRTNKNGLQYFHTGDQANDFVVGKSSLFYLKRFKRVNA